MRSARALAAELDERRHGKIDPFTYGLFTGFVVTYARPFTESVGGYGRLPPKWSKFKDRPELKKHHDRLIELRKTLAAHTDETPHRRVAVFTRGALLGDRPAVTEGRSPINAPGTIEVLKLLEFQEQRLGLAIDELARRLQDLGYWPDGLMVELDASGGFSVVDEPEKEVFVDTRLD